MIADFKRFGIAPALLATLALTGCASELGGTCHDDRDCAGDLRCLQAAQSDRGICVYPASLGDLGSDHEPSHDLLGSDLGFPRDLLRDQSPDLDALPIPQDLTGDRSDAPRELGQQDSPFTEIDASDARPDTRADSAAAPRDASDAPVPRDAPQDRAGNPSEAKRDMPPRDSPAAAADI